MLKAASVSLSFCSRLLRYGWLVLVVSLVACGGGGVGGSTPPPPPPPPSADFTLTVSPATADLYAGESTVVSLSVAGTNGFTSSVAVQAGDVPSGVTASPATVTLTPGAMQSVTLSAAPELGASTSSITFTGTSGALSHTSRLALNVRNVPANTPPVRTRYVRTDANTPYFAWPNSSWIVYSPITSRFFVTDPGTNRVIALDARTQKVVGAIPVPGAYGIDDTPDHKLLYVGTQIGDVYLLDPVTMTVVRRYLAASIGPYGYSAYAVFVMADGRLALLGGQGGIANVDGYSSFAIWNPVDNSINIYASSYGAAQIPFGVPYTLVCGGFMGNIGNFTRTRDRQRVIIGSAFSDCTLCSILASTGEDVYTSGPGWIRQVATTHDGSLILPAYGTEGNVVVYDASTLAQKARFNVLGETSSAEGFFVSADSKTLYAPTTSIVYAYDLATHQQVGWFPNIVVTTTSGGMAVGPIDSPNIQAVDDTGLFAGPAEQGVGFLDATVMKTGAVGTVFMNGYVTPATGPSSGGIQISIYNPNPFGTIKDLYFGGRKATSVSTAPSEVRATIPGGVAGPADVYTFTVDGGMQILPDGFSYGPTILQVTPNMTTPDGGVGALFGYGFGPLIDGAPVPADLKVTVGGKPATIAFYDSNAYGVLGQPMPLQGIGFTIPPGLSGTADVTVTTGSGSATTRNAITILPALQQFSLPGAALAQGIYDALRDLYYFTDATRIAVFSRTQGGWLSPISIPGAVRLWGISLSPDGSKLAVSDAVGGAIFVVNPSSPSSGTRYPINLGGNGVIANPAGLSITDSGLIYFTLYSQGVTGASAYFKLDTNSGTLKDFQLTGPGLGASDAYLRTALSADNARVYFNNMGAVFAIDTATDKIFRTFVGPGCCYGDYDLTLSSNQTRFAATSYLYDSDLNGQAYLSLNHREQDFFRYGGYYLYGSKLSSDGSLYFQPTSIGIDVFDGRTGGLRNRVALATPLSEGFDALVANGRDNMLVAITGNGDGIAVVDLTSLPEPAPWPTSPEPLGRNMWSSAVKGAVRVPSARTQARDAVSSPRPERQGSVIKHSQAPKLLKAR